MNDYIFDVVPERFHEMVIANSVKGPVLVNYWSAQAGPCLKLWPTLEALAKEYNGRFLLINFNTDKFKGFAQQELGVVSVPTLQLYYQQQVVEVMHGAESEQSIRQLLSRHLPRSSDSLLANSIKLYNQQPQQAIDELKKLQTIDRDNPRINLSLIKLYFREKRFDEMMQYINEQTSAIKNNEEVISLSTHAQMQMAVASVDDMPIEALASAVQSGQAKSDQQYAYAALSALNDESIIALEQLLLLMQQDAGYKDHLPSKTMVLILNAMGSDSDIARQYRAKMMDILSS